jgi:hypothetical protein
MYWALWGFFLLFVTQRLLGISVIRLSLSCMKLVTMSQSLWLLIARNSSASSQSLFGPTNCSLSRWRNNFKVVLSDSIMPAGIRNVNMYLSFSISCEVSWSDNCNINCRYFKSGSLSLDCSFVAGIFRRNLGMCDYFKGWRGRECVNESIANSLTP